VLAKGSHYKKNEAINPRKGMIELFDSKRMVLVEWIG